TDTDTDTDTDDWSHCPGAAAWVGDESWTGALVATSDAVYCGGQNEARTLAEELAAKTKLRIPEGTYKMPAAEGEHTLAIPACTIRQDAATQPGMNGPGSTEVSPATYAGTTYSYVTGTQPMLSSGGAIWSFDHTVVLVGPEGGDPQPHTLDGTVGDTSTGAGADFVARADGVSSYDIEAIAFQPCRDDTWPKNLHTVEFDGGSVEIEVWIGNDLVITAPAGFTRARGELDGTAFDITSYFQLVYRPGHHHFDRHFAVVFDAPIGDACSLLVENVDMQQGTQTALVSVADCALTATGSRSVTAEDWVVE
ncbi:MAG: hypothetical protein FJ090_01865, partial [Deltaproteobacteria bacterium]|nr:hypothetical protein [Deltaproteobacteria bacterium]